VEKQDKSKIVPFGRRDSKFNLQKVSGGED
jgi:hypothetical protein